MELKQCAITADALSKIKERRIEMYSRFAAEEPSPPPPMDKFTGFGQTIGCMAKNLRQDRQHDIMHQVYTLMHDNRADRVPVSTYYDL